MTDSRKPAVGTVGWIDLTVENAEEIMAFYNAVVGWTTSPVDMGDYSDFNMNTPESGEPVAGVCHARGGNADIPPHWMIYITVEDVDESITQCRERGGEVVVAPRDMGAHGRYCVIRDPAGAVAALIAPPAG
jgi:predicted enzyme related to lactoylglutathione lyase